MWKRFFIIIVLSITVSAIFGKGGIFTFVIGLIWVFLGRKKNSNKVTHYNAPSIGGKEKHTAFMSCGAPFNPTHMERKSDGCEIAYYDRETINKEQCPVCSRKLSWGFFCAKCNHMNWLREDIMPCRKCGYFTDEKYL